MSKTHSQRGVRLIKNPLWKYAVIFINLIWVNFYILVSVFSHERSQDYSQDCCQECSHELFQDHSQACSSRAFSRALSRSFSRVFIKDFYPFELLLSWNTTEYLWCNETDVHGLLTDLYHRSSCTKTGVNSTF